MEHNIKQFLDKSVEEIFADRFSRYSKYIIQDRALPDIRDGLKPVQRRIIYSMFKEGNTFDKQFRKSAKTVGNVIGNYHPHGDVSVYEAMIRMSKTWKNNELLVIVHGNNGSIDGDNPAAMRYTEAKLSKYAQLMIEGIKEETVDMVLNFDDTEYEPVVLPTLVPNLLINGATGISSGYATDIPPHNPYEVIQACIYLNKHPNASVDDILKIMPGPDFPTGAIIEGIDGIKQAYNTGKGKIVLRAKYEINKNNIIISEIPYDINKSQLLQKIDLLRLEKKVDGIDEVIDESDQNGLQITIKLKKDTNQAAIINYLFKNTDLQKNYNFNMVSINKHKPQLLGVIPILNAFLQHRFEIITKQSKYRLAKANQKLHLLEGLILAVNNLDAVIKIIRSSKNKTDSKDNLIKAFKITPQQAEAIVMLQLYRLSNTDLQELYDNKDELLTTINELNTLLSSDDNIKKHINKQLEALLPIFNTPRKSQINHDLTNISFNTEDLIKDEECFITISKLGYIKRCNLRSYLASDGVVKYSNNDQLQFLLKARSKEKLLLVLSDGSYCIIPIYELKDMKYREAGEPISNLAKLNDGVFIIYALNFKTFNDYDYLYGLTLNGYLAKFPFKELNTTKLKQKIQLQKLKPNDQLLSCCVSKSQLDNLLTNNLLITTTNNRYLCLNIDSINAQNLKTVGKKIANYHKNELSFSINYFDKDILFVSDDYNYSKLSPLTINETDKLLPLFTPLVTKKQHIIYSLKLTTSEILILTDKEPIIIDTQKLLLTTPQDKLKSLPKVNNIIGIYPIF